VALAFAIRPAASGRLITQLRWGYWTTLLVVAAMVTASYLLLQQMMAAYQNDQRLLSLAASQKALSQRVIFLASAARSASRVDKTGLVDSLREATRAFEQNQEQLLGTIEQRRLDQSGSDLHIILFERPHHLDYFALGLAANAWRVVSAIDSELGRPTEAGNYLGGSERAQLDATVADATLKGFAALEEQVNRLADQRLVETLKVHRILFIGTLAVLVLIAVAIFRPLISAIERRTRELVEARNSMAHQAVHDGLTGLHNRAFLIDHFDTVIKGAHRRGERLAVIQLDLDRFKQINDTLGHHAGDFVLIKTAERIRENCRASDISVRLGGDEFVLVLNAAGGTEDIAGAARRILGHINRPIDYEGATILPGASAGIAVYPVDADNAQDLLVHADLALYRAKRIGGGAFSFFSDELRRELEHRKELERDLMQAIEARAFSVHYQPQISLSSGTVTGVEALLRWRHPVRGLVSPGEFIPVAEKSGLMAAIGRIVIEKAIAEAAEWHRAGIDFGRLAVNVSGTELREPDFSEFLFATLSRKGLPTHKLSLEIVESVILDDEKTGVAPKLREMRAAGIHLELDDFGTGYASLSHVNPNEIDRLKIDRRFVQNIHNNGDNTKIVRAITELARGLGISIIAEGAETEEELDLLLAIGCDHVQGYSIAFPMPASEARDWLRSGRSRRQGLPQAAVKRA
jgi:diguanylate cyclase (GGDEF)-like protein